VLLSGRKHKVIRLFSETEKALSVFIADADVGSRERMPDKILTRQETNDRFPPSDIHLYLIHATSPG
jgi:hypothetical protein